MPTNEFSKFNSDLIILTKGSTGRKISHSASNWARKKWHKRSREDIFDAAASLATDGAGLAGTAVGVVSLAGGGVVAASAAISVGLGAAVTAPITAVVVGVIGLGLMAKGAYSNREAAHAAMRPYVFNLIDNERPTREIHNNDANLLEASKHALYLMKEADSQFTLMGIKHKTRADAFNKSWTEFARVTCGLTDKNFLRNKQFIIANGGGHTGISQSNVRHLQIFQNMDLTLNRAIVAMEDYQSKQFVQGGDVFELMRRLIKLGNYLQCAHIVSLNTYSTIKGTPPINAGEDPFADWQFAKDTRKSLTDKSKYMLEIRGNALEWQRFSFHVYAKLK